MDVNGYEVPGRWSSAGHRPGPDASTVAVSTVAEVTIADVTAPAATAGAALLQVVADPVRWAVLQRLSDGTRCVCDLQEHVDVAANLLSYHLRVLREAELVTTARRGRWVDYTLAPDAAERVAAAMPWAGPSAGAPCGCQP